MAGRERDVDCSDIPHQKAGQRLLDYFFDPYTRGWARMHLGGERTEIQAPEQIEQLADLLIGMCKRECESLLRAAGRFQDGWVLIMHRIAGPELHILRPNMPVSENILGHGATTGFRADGSLEDDFAYTPWDAHDLEIWIALLAKVRALCGERSND